MKPKAIFATLSSNSIIDQVYSRQSRKILAEKLDFAEPYFKRDDPGTKKNGWKDVEFIFSTWGIPVLSEDQISEYFPKLRAVFYGAGSVQYFAKPYLKKGVRVFTSNEALSISVADFTVAQIILANKGYFLASRLYRGGSWDEARKYYAFFPGNEGTFTGIVGAGRIGKGVIQKLKNFRIGVNVFDPFLSASDAEKLGVNKKETLDELFSSSFVITNHLANNAQTKGMLQYRHFSQMNDYGIFINTGRGAQVDEAGLVRALKEKPGRTALLDVTEPEPVQKNSPFIGMENVIISPHLAGALNNEVVWLGEYITEEYLHYAAGEPLRSEVTENMLETMA